MSFESEDQLVLERKAESQTQTKILYTREFLLSLCDLDICKNLPSGFDASILSDLNEATYIVNERQRGAGGLCFQASKFSDRDTRSSALSDRGGEGIGSYSRGNSGRWDTRSSGSSDRDGDLETSKQDSGRPFGSQSRQNWKHSEHDGLLGSGTFPKPSGYGGPSETKTRSNSHFQLNKTSEPYQPPRPYKALPLRRKNDKDSCNDETFGSTNYSSEDRAEEERRRRVSFELMRKEQQKALQEKHKQILDYQRENADADIVALLENSVDKQNILKENEKADDSSLLFLADSSRPSTTQAPLSRPLVPPGFSNTTLEKNLRVQSSSLYFPTEARAAGTAGNLINNDEERRNKSVICVDTSMLENGPISDLVVNGDAKEANKAWEEVTKDDVSGQKEKSEPSHSLMPDSSMSILDKLFTSSLSKSSGSQTSSSLNQGFKEGRETSPAVAESSKFSHWFAEEENKHAEYSSSKDLLSLIVNNEKVGSPASMVSCDKTFEHLEPSVLFKIGGTTEKLDRYPATATMVGVSEQQHQGDKSHSRPVVLKCEDLEQAILADIEGSSSNLEHVVQGTWTAVDGKLEQKNSGVDDQASHHLLSLLQKGTKQENMVPATSTGHIGLFDKFSTTERDSSFDPEISEKATSGNSETVSSSEKTVTLEALLFGPGFMNELQSGQAPVSVQRVADNETNSASVPTSHRFQFSNSDARFFSSHSGDYHLNWPVNEREMVSPNDIQDPGPHYTPAPGKEYEDSLFWNSKLGTTGFVESTPNIHLAEENSLINGRTSDLPHAISQARALHQGLDNLSHRNQQLKFIGPESVYQDPSRNYSENHHDAINTASGPHIDPAAYHFTPHQMPVPGNFLQNLPLSGLSRGVALSHPANHLRGYVPDMNDAHNISSHQQHPNYCSVGMGIPGAVVGGDLGHRPDALQRLIEKELRLNERQLHPTAADHHAGIHGPEFDLSFRYK